MEGGAEKSRRAGAMLSAAGPFEGRVQGDRQWEHAPLNPAFQGLDSRDNRLTAQVGICRRSQPGCPRLGEPTCQEPRHLR